VEASEAGWLAGCGYSLPSWDAAIPKTLAFSGVAQVEKPVEGFSTHSEGEIRLENHIRIELRDSLEHTLRACLTIRASVRGIDAPSVTVSSWTLGGL
jgi:hypothetical protein